MPALRRAEKIDDLTVALTTSEPDSFLPINLTNLFMASPAQWEKLRAGPPSAEAAWNAFAAAPSGTGAFRIDPAGAARAAEYMPQRRLLGREAKTEKIVLLPIPEANARTAALLSGQVDWIEAPAPDSVPQIRAARHAVISNLQPHFWPWQPCFAGDSPLKDVRVRRALNLAIDRDSIEAIARRLWMPAIGTVRPGHPWWGNPEFRIRTTTRRRPSACWPRPAMARASRSISRCRSAPRAPARCSRCR